MAANDAYLVFPPRSGEFPSTVEVDVPVVGYRDGEKVYASVMPCRFSFGRVCRIKNIGKPQHKE